MARADKLSNIPLTESNHASAILLKGALVEFIIIPSLLFTQLMS